MVVRASKHSRLGQFLRWEAFYGFLHQNTGINPFIEYGIEKSLWCDEGDEHPQNMEEMAMGGSVACDVYVEVHCGPYTYDQDAKADREDPKRGPLLRFSNPQKQRICWERWYYLRWFFLYLTHQYRLSVAKEDVTNRCKKLGGYETTTRDREQPFMYGCVYRGYHFAVQDRERVPRTLVRCGVNALQT